MSGWLFLYCRSGPYLEGVRHWQMRCSFEYHNSEHLCITIEPPLVGDEQNLQPASFSCSTDWLIEWPVVFPQSLVRQSHQGPHIHLLPLLLIAAIKFRRALLWRSRVCSSWEFVKVLSFEINDCFLDSFLRSLLVYLFLAYGIFRFRPLHSSIVRSECFSFELGAIQESRDHWWFALWSSVHIDFASVKILVFV